MQCERCGKEVFLPFKCPYCGGYFCAEHRLPENHECPQMERARMPVWATPPTIVIQKQEPYEYSVTYVAVEPSKKGKIRFSTKEIQHLAVAALLVAGIALSLAIPLDSRMATINPTTLAALTLTIVASFFAHELAHKITAQKRGYWAEFRLTLMGAILTLISVISPIFKVISPGAVVVSGFADKESLGKVSIAGPATNIILSTMLLIAYSFNPQGALAQIFLFGAAFNAWIALFNLIPLGILDGFKVFLWSKYVWVSAFSASLILTWYSYTLIFWNVMFGFAFGKGYLPKLCL
ncbi:MAG: AN1-type zinc finger domain-containing protein [Candidatus Bathyarchaeales archaeon]